MGYHLHTPETEFHAACEKKPLKVKGTSGRMSVLRDEGKNVAWSLAAQGRYQPSPKDTVLVLRLWYNIQEIRESQMCEGGEGLPASVVPGVLESKYIYPKGTGLLQKSLHLSLLRHYQPVVPSDMVNKMIEVIIWTKLSKDQTRSKHSCSCPTPHHQTEALRKQTGRA